MPEDISVNYPALADVEAILTNAPIEYSDVITYPVEQYNSASSKPTVQELNVWGSFKRGPWTTDEEVLKAVKAGIWYPSSSELKVFAKSGTGTDNGAVNIWNFLCSIARTKPSRVNIFTHANESYIGFSGEVVVGDVKFANKGDTELSVELMQIAEQEGYTFSDTQSKDVTMGQVRTALGPSAEIVIYACHVGLNESFLRDLANFIGAKVSSFKPEIRYYPESTDGKTIKYWRYSAGSTEKVADFHRLKTDITVFPTKPVPKSAPK